MEHVYDKLAEYSQGPDYPFHMPGHKRRTFGEMPPELYRMDITEIDGFDNLHAPEGILRDLQERASALYGAEESFVLVNGSTGGILSAVSAAVPMGGKLLMSRNCHKSAYHAAYLRKLKISYLYPEILREFEISEAVTPEQVREALQRERDIDAVLIVSPTYEGRIARVREIAEIVHSFGKPLIVDEAHGAHLGLAGTVPENSCQAGADLVIHSLHKTLPAMTQTALLHVNGERVDRDRLKRFLRIYQSSSPSYVLMASADNALAMVEKDGRKLFGEFHRRFLKMMWELRRCKRLKFLAAQSAGERRGRPSELSERHGGQPELSECQEPGMSESRGELSERREPGLSESRSVLGDPLRQDMGKLVICDGTGEMSGQELYDRLRQQYHLQLEMAAGRYCLAMFTIGDTSEGYRRMTEALLEIDRELDGPAGEPEEDRKSSPKGRGGEDPEPEFKKTTGEKAEEYLSQESKEETGKGSGPEPIESPGRIREEAVCLPEKGLEFHEAWDCPWEEVPLAQCAGRMAADFVNLFPPGSPILVPGERYTPELCGLLRRYMRQGLNLQGVSGVDMLVKCIRECDQ